MAPVAIASAAMVLEDMASVGMVLEDMASVGMAEPEDMASCAKAGAARATSSAAVETSVIVWRE